MNPNTKWVSAAAMLCVVLANCMEHHAVVEKDFARRGDSAGIVVGDVETGRSLYVIDTLITLGRIRVRALDSTVEVELFESISDRSDTLVVSLPLEFDPSADPCECIAVFGVDEQPRFTNLVQIGPDAVLIAFDDGLGRGELIVLSSTRDRLRVLPTGTDRSYLHSAMQLFVVDSAMRRVIPAYRPTTVTEIRFETRYAVYSFAHDALTSVATGEVEIARVPGRGDPQTVEERIALAQWFHERITSGDDDL